MQVVEGNHLFLAGLQLDIIPLIAVHLISNRLCMCVHVELLFPCSVAESMDNVACLVPLWQVIAPYKLLQEYIIVRLASDDSPPLVGLHR